MSLTDAEAPPGVAIWVRETFKTPHHIKVWIVMDHITLYYIQE